MKVLTRSERRWLARSLICWPLILLSFNVGALILTGEGNGPVRDNGWPEGALAVANLSTRSSWWEGPPFGGGEYHFDYRGSTEQFQEALEAFSKIIAPRLELVIHGEPSFGFAHSRSSGTNAPTPVDWSFTIWNPERWHLLYNNPKSFFGSDQPNFRQPVASPRIDVYPGFGIRWDQVKVPTNVTVLDRRLASIGMPAGSGTVIRADVFDIATGKPVKGARLDVAKPSDKGEYESFAGQETDARGHVELTKVPGANLRLSVSASDYARKEIGYQSGGSNTLINLVVELSKSSSVTGRVIDTAGEPVSGAKLSPANTLGIDGRGYASPTRAETVTDQDGRFEFKNLPHGFTGIWMMDPRFHYSGINDLYPVPSRAEEPIEIRVSRTGSIRISIFDKNGKPLAEFDRGKVMVSVEPTTGAKVGTWGGSANVETNGTREFTGVPPGDYRITTQPNPGSSAKEYAPPQTVTVKAGQTADVRMLYH